MSLPRVVQRTPTREVTQILYTAPVVSMALYQSLVASVRSSRRPKGTLEYLGSPVQESITDLPEFSGTPLLSRWLSTPDFVILLSLPSRIGESLELRRP